GGSWRAGPPDEPPPLLDPDRTRDPHRIFSLFVPYRARLASVIGLIVFSSGLSMISPFLLRSVLDDALPHRTGTLLTQLVLGMIAIAIATAAFSVWQTYISNVIGQRVMHDLRAAVYRHLQRMSLAFFTRTRTGEVQSRIANDIGGLDNAVTTTATSIAQNATTVIASLVAMCLLDWQLAIISLVFLPPFVLLSPRGGPELPRRLDLDRDRGRIHDAPDQAAVPDSEPARRGRRRRGLDGTVRPDLRVPRPAGRHRRSRAASDPAPGRGTRGGAFRARVV